MWEECGETRRYSAVPLGEEQWQLHGDMEEGATRGRRDSKLGPSCYEGESQGTKCLTSCSPS